MDSSIIKLLKEEILPKFQVEGELIDISSPSSTGNINKTFLITYKLENGEEKQYILQKINDKVFNNPYEVMENIEKTTNFISELEPNKETLHVIPVKNPLSVKTKSMLVRTNDLSEQEYWRMYNCITNSISYDVSSDPVLFEKVGEGFGLFHEQLSSFPMNELHETIPDFHNTRKRYLNFLKTVRQDNFDRVKNCPEAIKEIMKYNHDYSIITELLEEEQMPVRVTHNDTKINNILMDKTTGDIKCIIDLDTVMPGSVLYDIGDAIRSGASTAAEDERDLSKVSIDLNLVEAFFQGYFDVMAEELKDSEFNNIYNSIVIITLELAMRFLTDYLDGDKYFTLSNQERPNLNLERAINQIELAKDIISKEHLIKEIIYKTYDISIFKHDCLKRKREKN